MRRILVISFILFSTFATAKPPSDRYHLIWSDEFEGTALDTTKWEYRGLGPRRDAINVKETVTLDGKGHLVLTTAMTGKDYHTAMIGTQGKLEALYGYFECRVRLQKQVGHWSAFWLQSPWMGEREPQKIKGTEIDIFEYLARTKDTLHLNLHWGGYGQGHKHVGKDVHVKGIGEGYHTVGLEWRPREYVFFVDDLEVWRTNTAVSHVKQYIILSLEVGKWAGNIKDAILPDHVYFDYLRVYQK